MNDKSPTELNKKRIAAIKLRDKCERDIKDITRKMSEHIRISILGENLLSDYKWELSTAGGYGGKVTFYTIIPKGDEWKLMNLIPADEFDRAYPLVDDAVELAKRDASTNSKGLVYIYLSLDSAVFWVKELGLKIHGDFDKLIDERCTYADKYSDEAATFRMLKRMVDD